MKDITDIRLLLKLLRCHWGGEILLPVTAHQLKEQGNSKVRLALILKAMLNINDIILTTENVEFSIFFFISWKIYTN